MTYRFTISALLLLGTILPPLARAQWVQTGGPFGGCALTLAASGGDLLAGTLGSGVFLSTNNGTSWTSASIGLTNTTVWALAPDTVTGNLFAGTQGDGVFLSTNNGTNWTAANSGMANADVLSFAISSPNLFAGTISGIFLSTNNGTSWTPVDSGLTNTYVNALAFAGTNLFAGTYGGGVFLSTNNGTSWTAVNTGLTNAPVNALAVSGLNLFAGTGGGVFLSTNNGTSWTPVDSGLTNTSVRALAISGTNLFAGTGGGVFLSTNNGTSWTPVDSGLTNTSVRALAISGTNLFAGTFGGGVFLSTNSGTSWTEVNTGLTNTSVRALAASTATGKFFAAAYESGVFLSTDNGTSWTEVNTGLTNTNVSNLAVSGTNVFAGTEGGVFFSTNSGTNWTAVNTGLTNISIRALAVSGMNIFAGSDNGVCLSTNNGTSWTPVNAGLTTTYVRAFAVSGTNLFAGTDGGGVFLSTNNGASWTQDTVGLTNTSVRALAISGTNLFAGTFGGGVFLSTNSGTSWTGAITGLTDPQVWALAALGTNLFAGTDGGGVFLSTNNGTSWTAVNTGLTNNIVFALGLSPDSSAILAGTDGSGVWRRPLSEFTGSISGTVFSDRNSNGIRDAGELGLSGWTVYVQQLPISTSSLIDTTITDSLGRFFSALADGTYLVSEVQHNDYLETSPPAPGSYTVTVTVGSSIQGLDFGNAPTVQYVGSPGSSWSNPSNWAGGHLPADTQAVVLQDSVTYDLHATTVAALRVGCGGALSISSTGDSLTIAGPVVIDSCGSMVFPSGLPKQLTCGGDWINHGSFVAGNSTVVFSGDRHKSIDATPFWNLTIAGDSTHTLDNISIGHQLSLNRTLLVRPSDTLFVRDSSLNAITYSVMEGTRGGSINRKIRTGETGQYTFESGNTYVQFYGTSQYPDSVTMTTVLPTSSPRSFTGLKWMNMGGIVDTVNHFVTVDSVGHFSTWTLVKPGAGSAFPKIAATDSFATPSVLREYKIRPGGGSSSYLTKLQLRYDPSEALGSQSGLTAARGPVAVNPVNAGWNMVSLPVTPEDLSVSAVFGATAWPWPASDAFSYNHGYYISSTLQIGKGYWLKFASAGTVEILGDDRAQDSVSVSAGWNMIGVPSYPVARASIVSVPAGIIKGSFFGYNNGYSIPDSLRPMQGYWIKVSGPGKLVLGQPDTAISNKVSPAQNPLSSLNTLTIRDQSKGGQTLYFGRSDKLDVSQFELPPPPPKGVFDARFTTGHLVELADTGGQKDVPLALSSAVFPLTIGWDASKQNGTYALWIDGKETILRGQASVTVAQLPGLISLRLSAAPLSGLPKQFALYQNYPNPFNPSTTIRFDLPQDAVVTLKVFNILGQEVAKIVENKSYTAGSYGEQFSTARLASGVYFYQIIANEVKGLPQRSAQSFVRTRKMLLLR